MDEFLWILIVKDDWHIMAWGIFGPVRFQTRRGGRVTIFAMWMILPSFAISFWNMFSQQDNTQKQQRSMDLEMASSSSGTEEDEFSLLNHHRNGTFSNQN